MNDHETLRLDPLLASLVGSRDPKGRGRKRERGLDKPLAAPSRVHRLELSHSDPAEGDRYRRIAPEPQKVDEFLVTLFPRAHEEPPESVVLDLDATADPLTVIRRVASSTATTTATATCRSRSWLVSTSRRPGCGQRAATVPRGASRSWSGSCLGSARHGSRHASSCGTIRARLLRIGARVRVTGRKVWISMSESYPDQDLFFEVWARLRPA